MIYHYRRLISFNLRSVAQEPHGRKIEKLFNLCGDIDRIAACNRVDEMTLLKVSSAIV
jgi:hypothetical protein